MMIIMQAGATQEQIKIVVDVVQANGLRAHLSTGEERTIIGAIGDGRPVMKEQFLYLPGVDRVVPISRPYKLASGCSCNQRNCKAGVTDRYYNSWNFRS